MHYYSQNFEDVLLWRCFRDHASGFFIDVGAENPEIDSVTKLLYDHGWHGINIEPQPDAWKLFNEQRKRDVNLNIALGSESCSDLVFYTISGGIGLAGFGDDVRQRIIDHGAEPVGIKVPVRTLDQICQEHTVESIDFLKIDVEGFELPVLEGFAFSPAPRLICIEVTLPNTHRFRADHQSITELLASREYKHVLFDGLNDWWLRPDQLELEKHFRLPPNCLDSISPSSIYQHEKLALDSLQELDDSLQELDKERQRLEALHQQLEAASQRNNALESIRADLMTRIETLEAELIQAYTSLSWKITKPLRFANRGFKRLKSRLGN